MEIGENTRLTSAERKAPKTSETVYANLIGFDRIPEKAEDFPEEIFLPSQVLGSLEQAILGTKADGRERSQLIGWDSKASKYRKSRVYIGTDQHTSFMWSMKIFSKIITLGGKALTDYHTHPLDLPLNQVFSEQDIAVILSAPKISFIDMLGSRMLIHATFQTAEASRKLTSPFKKATIERRIMNKHWTFAQEASHYDKNHSYLAHIIESEGLVHYSWQPPLGDLGNGDMLEGVRMRKTKALPIPEYVGLYNKT